jgi:hypothetical protein
MSNTSKALPLGTIESGSVPLALHRLFTHVPDHVVVDPIITQNIIDAALQSQEPKIQFSRFKSLVGLLHYHDQLI